MMCEKIPEMQKMQTGKILQVWTWPCLFFKMKNFDPRGPLLLQCFFAGSAFVELCPRTRRTKMKPVLPGALTKPGGKSRNPEPEASPEQQRRDGKTAEARKKVLAKKNKMCYFLQGVFFFA
jgi:hypothetical protein